MKVGILTFHRAINFGAVLQAYALQEVLSSLGQEVRVINYMQPRVENTDRRKFKDTDKLDLLKGFHLRAFFTYDRNKDNEKKKRARFDKFIQKYIHLSEECTSDSIPDNYDVYVVGSDQVWNSNICGGIDDIYWGNFKRKSSSLLISYAASTSVANLKSMPQEMLQSFLCNYDYMSTRETDVASYLNSNFKLKEPLKVVLDPTLLASPQIWDAMKDDTITQPEPYVLYFGARCYAKNPHILEIHAQKIATKMGLSVRTIDFNRMSPIDFVNAFRNASYVVSSSFHGVAFSIIFNKPLNAIVYGDEQDSRYVNLLKMVGADDMIHDVSDFSILDYNYTTINNGIESLRKESMDYLNKIL